MKNKENLSAKLCYACGDIYGGGAFLLVSLLYLNFLTDIVHISPAVAGSIFLVGKIWDAISDPLMGVISDRTRSRFGRRRIYFLIGILPGMLSFAMLWVNLKTDNQLTLYVYYLFSYIFFNTALTLVYIPYSSILPAMTNDYQERSSFITIRLIFSNISALISAVLPMFVINSFQPNIQKGYMVMGIVFGLFYSLPYIPLFLGTYENDYKKDAPLEKLDLKLVFHEFSTVFRNKSFRIYSGFFITAQTAVNFVVTLFIYYLTYVLNKGDMFAPVLGVLLVVQIISMPIHMKISHKLGKTKPLNIGLPVWTVALVIAFFINAESNSIFIFIIAILSGFGCSASIFVPWSVFPELADIDELITNQRREGIYSGISTLIMKIAQAITIAGIGVVLELVGYVPNIPQSNTTILGIKIMFSAVPILLASFALFFASKYKLNENSYKVVKGEIERRKSGDNSPVGENTAKICQEVTGLTMEQLRSM